jgi:TolA-binding protein
MISGALLFFSGYLCLAQVLPLEPEGYIERSGERELSTCAGALTDARFQFERELSNNPTYGRKADIIFSIARLALRDHEDEQAYQWSTTFLTEYPHDRRQPQATLIRGISAYQTERIDTAIAALNVFLSNALDDPGHGEAFYWRGLCEIEQGDWSLAEADFRSAFRDSLANERRDIILLAWSLTLEHRGEIAEAADKLEQMMSDYPESDYIMDARLRLASLSLQRHDPRRAIELLKEVKLKYRSQREESLLLAAESNLQSSYYESAQTDFKAFLAQYGQSEFTIRARSGLAWTYFRSGDSQDARLQFDSLGAQEDTIGLRSLYQSGAIALMDGKNAEAATEFERLVDRSPYDVDADKAYYLLGMIDYQAKRYRDARKNFEIVAKLFPESKLQLPAFRMLGEANFALGDFANAQYAFAQLRRLNAPDSLLAPSMFREGISLYYGGRFRSSAERFSDFLDKYPNDRRNSQAYAWKGEALFQDARYEEAEQAYSEALRLSPGDEMRSVAAYGVAWALFEEKKFSQAAAAFDKFTRDYPQSEHLVDASLRKADCYLFMREYDKANQLYASLATAKNESKTSEYAAFQLAMSYIQQGESLRGIDELRQFQRDHPNSIYAEVVQFNIGWTYFTMEQYPQAITELRSTMERFPESQLLPRVLFNMGDAFYNSKQFDSARVYYQQVIDRFPSSLLLRDAVNGLKFTYEAQGNSAAALSALDRYIGTKRDTSSLQQELFMNKADLLFGQGDLKGASAQYDSLIAMNPEKPLHARALQQLGHIAGLLKDTSKAVAYYLEVLQGYPETESAPVAALALGITYNRIGNFDQAVQTLGGFDSRYPSSPLIIEAQYEYGIALESSGARDSSEAQFQAIITQHPADIFADRSRMQIARIDQDAKEYRTAIDTLEGIVNRRSDDLAAEALIMMGDNYLSLKKSLDALESYNDVITQYKDYPLLIERARLGAGSAYEALKDRKHAREQYEEVAKNGIDELVRKDAAERLKRLKRK